jgi:hypothetical protein
MVTCRREGIREDLPHKTTFALLIIMERNTLWSGRPWKVTLVWVRLPIISAFCTS